MNPFSHFARKAAPVGTQKIVTRLVDRIGAEPPAHERLTSGTIADACDDVRRICALPIRPTLTIEEYERYCESLMLQEAWDRGDRLNIHQVESALAWRGEGGAFGQLAVGSGKCVAGTTVVFDASTGKRTTVREAAAHGQPFLVPCLLDNRIQNMPASAFLSGCKDCVDLTLKGGQSVTLSVDHPVLTGRGWVQAAQITVDDLVATPRHIPLSTETTLSSSFVRMVAYLSADGGLTQAQATFTNETPDVIDDFTSCVSACGGYLTERKSRSKAREFYVNGIGDLRREWGLFGSSMTKRLPTCFYSLPDYQVAEFLNAFWACDGCVGKKNLEVTLANEGLIDDLRFLLLRLGIHARKRGRGTTWTYKEERRFGYAWVLNICSRDNCLRFLDVVGDVRGKTSRCQELRSWASSEGSNPNCDLIPFSTAEYHALCDELGFTYATMKRNGKGQVVEQGSPRSSLRKRLSVTDGQFVSRQNFVEWARETGYTGKFSWLASSEILWDRVASVLPTAHQQVYDLSVPGVGNFVADGIIVHNTLILQLLASLARADGHQRIVLLLPRGSIEQLLVYDLPFVRSMIPYGVEGPHSFKDLTPKRRALLASSGKKGLYLLPYSLLSTRDENAPDLLEAIRPTVVLADECYFLKNSRTSACARRVVRYLKKHNPRFAAVAGSITSKGPDDYAHLLNSALHERSPMPLDHNMLTSWSLVISAGAMPSGAMAAPLTPLVEWARANFPEEKIEEDIAGFRRAFTLRLESAPGVVATGEAGINTSLTYTNLPVPDYEQAPGWPALKALIDQVAPPLRLTPNGDEIAHKIHAFKWLSELKDGFYNELTWPQDDDLARRRKISRGEAQDHIGEGKAHLKARKAYYKELGKWFDSGEHVGSRGHYLDTPEMVGQEMFLTGAKHVSFDLYVLWQEMKALEKPAMAQRDKRAVRVCPYKIHHVREWCKTLPKSDPGAIIWVHNTELGAWTYEVLLEEFGPERVLHAPAGDENKAGLRDPVNKDRIVVASLPSHYHTLNLQHHGNMFFLQWSRNATHMEQGVGRIHRQKQLRDALVIHSCNTLPEDDAVFSASVVDALYQHQTGGGRQKLLYGDWDPLPVAMPPEALKAMGVEVKSRLDPAHRRILDEKFIRRK